MEAYIILPDPSVVVERFLKILGKVLESI